jgi:hypothetical protein
MKTIALTLFAAALGFAQSGSPAAASPAATSPAATSTPKAANAAQNKKPAPASKLPGKPPAKAEGAVQAIPAGATQVEPNLYRYTDSSGKTWNYRQTPFGISKWEETPASGPQPAAQAAPTASPALTEAKSEPVVVTDLGDSYRFEKKTPFGASTWIRKKSELNENEKALAAQQSQSSTTPASLNAKPAGNQ